MTETQQKVHKLLQLAMECESHHVHVGYQSHVDGIGLHVYERPYHSGSKSIHSELCYIDGGLEDSQEFGSSKLDEMIAYVEALS